MYIIYIYIHMLQMIWLIHFILFNVVSSKGQGTTEDLPAQACATASAAASPRSGQARRRRPPPPRCVAWLRQTLAM